MASIKMRPVQSSARKEGSKWRVDQGSLSSSPRWSSYLNAPALPWARNTHLIGTIFSFFHLTSSSSLCPTYNWPLSALLFCPSPLWECEQAYFPVSCPRSIQGTLVTAAQWPNTNFNKWLNRVNDFFFFAHVFPLYWPL